MMELRESDYDGGEVVPVSRDMLLSRLAEIDAFLHIMETYDVDELYAERSEITWLLGDE